MRSALLFFCWLLTAIPAQTQKGNEAAYLDTILRTYHQLGLFNGNVLITQKGKPLLEKSYGWADAGKTRNSTQTKFNVYSITKSFTATLVLQLASEKKLSLDDRLSSFYPSLPGADSILIRHLLSHSSGIYAYNNDFEMPVQSEEAMIQWLAKKSLDFSPGTAFRYSNTGYFLLGYIIQKVTGLSYEKAVQQYILDPLGMHDTGFDLRKVKAGVKAKGYLYISNTGAEQAPVWDYRELFSAGGLYSTTHDLERFHRALQDHSLLPAAATQQAYILQQKNYGFGWFIDSLSGRQLISHSGGATGFRSYLIRDIANDICIILLCNTETSDIVAIRNRLLQALNGEHEPLPKVPGNLSQKLPLYFGAYQLTPSVIIYVHREKGQFMATPNRGSSSFLMPTGSDSFRLEARGADLRFKTGKTGRYDSLVFTQQGQTVTAPRLPASWGITGSATANGWEGADIPLRQQGNLWTLSPVSLKDGVIKFRYNNDWVLHYGVDTATGSLKKGAADIPVKAGRYTLTLDLADSDRPKWKLRRLP